jgi:hypothetical protein
LFRLRPAVQAVRCVASNNVYKVVPRRAFLYLPGHDERKATKAVSLGVDSICLDCEVCCNLSRFAMLGVMVSLFLIWIQDAVALERKEDARQGIVNILQNVSLLPQAFELWLIRISHSIAVSMY